MRKIEEVRQLTDLEEIIKEWAERQKLAAKMVGRLYPSILADESEEIETVIGRIFQEKGIPGHQRREMIRRAMSNNERVIE